MIFPAYIIINTVVVIAAAAVGIATPIILHKKNTPVEQAAEAIIKDKTGVDVDFSANQK